MQKGVLYSARPKGVKYQAISSRGKWGELQDPCTVLQERCVQKRVQYSTRPLWGGVVLAIESVCDTVGAGHKPMCAR